MITLLVDYAQHKILKRNDYQLGLFETMAPYTKEHDLSRTCYIRHWDYIYKYCVLISVSAVLSTNVYWPNMVGIHTKSQFQSIILDSNQPILFL